METIRVIIDPPAGGAWNMSVDHVLLESANRSGRASIRFYQWAEPTLSLGYFQRAADRYQHPASLECTMVRRSTGGGAILHDHDLTYSLSVPETNRWSAANERLYFMMHQIAVELLAERGVESSLFEGDPAQFDREAFLCFQRRSPGDLVLKGMKIGGSAQRRKKNALLQHGSLLLQKSDKATELAGIEDLSNFPGINIADITQSWINKLSKTMGVNLSLEELTDLEIATVFDISKEFYATDAWNLRR